MIHCVPIRAVSLFDKPDREEGIMSKAMSYVVVSVVAFLVGGFSFQLIGRTNEGNVESKSAEGRINGGNVDAVVPRMFAIEGMTCQGCADSITSALTRIPGVQSANVSLQEKQAVVSAKESEVPTEKILAAIASAGYKGQLASGAQTALPTTATFTKQPILVNITRGKNELHAVSMALGLAQSAIKDGRNAAVFLNVEAPVFAAKDLGDDTKFADFPPVKKMLVDFIAMGGRVLVCGHCAHVVKLGQRDMIDGVKILAHGELFAAMPPGTVVFSY
jgi:copper chaperone CopZ/predicted peroxiredoxin